MFYSVTQFKAYDDYTAKNVVACYDSIADALRFAIGMRTMEGAGVVNVTQVESRPRRFDAVDGSGSRV